MSEAPTQQALDEMFAMSPEDRALMHGGQLPPRISRFLGNPGCIRAFVLLAGLVVGAMIGGTTQGDFAARTGLSPAGYILMCAVIGAVLGIVYFRLRFEDRADRMTRDLARITVRNEVLRLRLKRRTGSRGRDQLIADDGRVFILVTSSRLVEIDGTYHLFYVDLSSVRTPLSSITGETLFALALELI
jgi:uncharacterized membrane protein YeaQ/YmgE (transglycosylase-associated protein family)